MNKKFFLVLTLIIFNMPVFSTPVVETPVPLSNEIKQVAQVQVEDNKPCDWLSKTQAQRDEDIKTYQKLFLSQKLVEKYPKKEFKAKYAPYYKDKSSMQHYALITNGVKSSENQDYAGFFLKNGLLLAYAIQYKNNPKEIYYYDAMGHMFLVETFSDCYPNFPYYSLQYYKNGKLFSFTYFVSKDDQYVFDNYGSFMGRWYKENMYNRKGKITLKRSNW